MKTPVFHFPLFALVGLVLSPLTVVHASSSAASPLPVTTLEGHTDWVRSVSFSPDGILLASGSLDGTVKLWDTSEWVPSRPQRLVKISGDNQQGPVGEQLVEPFVVSVLDTHGAPFVGAVVTFAVTTGGGTISVTTTTDADGRAAITLTLGSDPGPNTAEATVDGLEPVTFTAIGYAVPHSSDEGFR